MEDFHMQLFFLLNSSISERPESLRLAAGAQFVGHLPWINKATKIVTVTLYV